jgi:RNA polymerase sigma factor (sigma-70 family)
VHAPSQQALLSDTEIVQAVLDGQLELFGTVIRRHQDPMHRLAYSMVQDADTASDMVQDTFVRAYAGLATCREPARLRVWLMTMVRNRCLDHLKERRRSDVPLDAVTDRGQAVATNTLNALCDRTELQRALDALPSSLREAFLLRHVEDMSYEDMAHVLGSTVAGVKMRVSRARDALRQHLSAANYPGPEAP